VTARVDAVEHISSTSAEGIKYIKVHSAQSVNNIIAGEGTALVGTARRALQICECFIHSLHLLVRAHRDANAVVNTRSGVIADKNSAI
jgi:hypothetical protein